MANTASSITIDLEKSAPTHKDQYGNEYLDNSSGSTSSTTGGSAITIPGGVLSGSTAPYGLLDQFVESLPFIIFFLVMSIFISMQFGAKALTYFLVVVLISMLLFNQDKLSNLFGYIKF